MGTSRGSKFFPLRLVPYDMENHFYHIRWPPLNVTIFNTIFNTHMRNCVMGATPNAWTCRLFFTTAEVLFRPDFFMKSNNTNPVQLLQRSSLIWVHIVFNIGCRQEEQTAKWLRKHRIVAIKTWQEMVFFDTLPKCCFTIGQLNTLHGWSTVAQLIEC